MHRVRCPILPQAFSLVLCPRRTVEHILFFVNRLSSSISSSCLSSADLVPLLRISATPRARLTTNPRRFCRLKPASVFDEPRVWLRELHDNPKAELQPSAGPGLSVLKTVSFNTLRGKRLSSHQ